MKNNIILGKELNQNKLVFNKLEYYIYFQKQLHKKKIRKKN